MSYYYNYCVGYEHEGKLYPLGPYDSFGKLRDVVSRSRSFASDLHERFNDVLDAQISDELRKQFEHENWVGEKCVDVKWLPVNELPNGSFVKTGYFLIEDVESYERDGDTWDIFYDTLTPAVYAQRLHHEMTFGPPKPVKDCEGVEYTPHAVSDYMYYAYPDYGCMEYEAMLLSEAAKCLHGYSTLPKGAKIVILETEG